MVVYHIGKNGSITSVQAVYVPADDLTDPALATTFATGCQRCWSRNFDQVFIRRWIHWFYWGFGRQWDAL